MKAVLKKYQSILILICMFFINLMNYGLNLVLARFMGPDAFAEAHILATLVLAITFLGVSVQMTAAKLAAEKSYTKELKRYVYTFSFVVATLGMMLSPMIASFVKMQNVLAIGIIMVSIPFYLLLSLKRGLLQGSDDMVGFTASFVSETIVRIGVSILSLFLFMESYFLILGLSIAFLLSFLLPILLNKSVPSMKLEKVKQELNKGVFKFVLVFMIYEFSQVLISNGDYFIVKSQFGQFESGLYASITLIGKMIFYGAWVFVMIMFPKLIQARKESKSTSKILFSTLAIVMVAGLSASIICHLFGEQIITILFGDQYGQAFPFMASFALLTTLFAGANVIIYYYLSDSNYHLACIAVLIGITEIMLLNVYNGSLAQIISIQILLMSVLFTVSIGYYLIENFYSKFMKSIDGLLNLKLDLN